MPGAGVAANDQDASCVFDFAYGVSHGTASETGGQTGHRWGVSERGTVIHIVRLHHHSRELLCQVILLVSAFS